MRSLNGHISSTEMELVNNLTDIRFANKSELLTPEALIVYEQKLLSEDELLKCCEEEYKVHFGIEKLDTMPLDYLPREIINHFSDSECVPLKLDTVKELIYVGVLPENSSDHLPAFKHYKLIQKLLPIYLYVKYRTQLYSIPKFLLEIPARDVFDFIVAEAISLEASDLTLGTTANSAHVYYNVRKKKIYSKRALSKADVPNIIKIVSSLASSNFTETDVKPKYMSLVLDQHHRGRVVINQTYHGKNMTIRILSNESFSTTLEDLNIEDKTISFIREKFLSMENGLRLLVGPTFSGKNTTILSALNELIVLDKYKIVSVEKPVEILVDKLEQIDVDSEELFLDNVDSLLRQNPDIVYLSEITGFTAEAILGVANTAKPVYSSIHANSIADIIARLQDLTGLSTNRIVMNLHSAIFQMLERDEEKDILYPTTNFIYFSEELKLKLFDKSLGEIYTLLREEGLDDIR